MNIEPHEISVAELTEGYEDNDEGGVVGYGGKLDIRPQFQREFIYKPKQRDAVIDTIIKGYPLNVMYWAVRDQAVIEEGDLREFEIMDGQQRTISICQYVEGDFAFEGRYFHNLQRDEKKRICDYKLTVYLCSGDDSEKLEWFKTINIAGLELTDQELRNAVYAGPMVSDAKRYFSRSGCPAYGIASDYIGGALDRQAYLEEAFEWINDGDVEGYMAQHQQDPNARDLWLHFQAVITWVEATFTVKRRPMKGLPWGELYKEFKDAKLDPVKLEEEIATLMADEDVKKQKGIYRYVLDRDERHLNIRQFSNRDRQVAYERQKGLCANKTRCLTPGNSDGKKKFEITEMEADHITPWSKGGRTEADNCQMLCLPCNRQKGGV